MSDKECNSSCAGGFMGMLFLLFLGLKLGKVIDWSWWWVTAPLWLPVSVALALGIVGMLIGFLAYWWENKNED